MGSWKFFLFLSSALLSAGLRIGGAAGQSFQPIGDINGGAFKSEPLAISSNGLAVVGEGTSSLGQEAFRWTANDGMMGLGDLLGGDFFSRGSGVSADGSIVVGRSSSSSGIEAFRWMTETGMVGLGDLPGGSFFSRGSVVGNDNEAVYGWSNSESGDQAFKWTELQGMSGLGFLPGASISRIYNKSGNGEFFLGQSGTENELYAARWSDGIGWKSLGTLEPSQGFIGDVACAASFNGSVIVGGTTSTPTGSGTQGFIWTEQEGMTGLGDLPGGEFSSFAYAMSGDGSLVFGASSTGLDREEVFIWDAVNKMRNFRDVLETEYGLDLTGWLLTEVTSVSIDGNAIVGAGINPQGNLEGWRVALPEPFAEDINGDGSVDAADAGIMFGNWGGSGTGDLTDDGIVDAADAGQMFAAWTGDLDTNSAVVPEANSLILLGVGISVLLWTHRNVRE